MVDGRRHRDRARRRPAALAAALTAAVTVGAAGVVAVARDGGAPASVPESLDRPAATAPTGPTATTGPTETTGSAATAGPAATAAPQPTRPAPVAAGTLQAPATRTGPPVPAGAGSAGSRQRRPVPTTPAPAPADGPGQRGTATFYTLAGLPNCGYQDAAGTGRYVALGPAEWRSSAACGTVLDVTGPRGTVRVTVSDQCPECGPGHLDLAPPAFAAIADPVAGLVPVRYTRVVDPPTGPVRIRVKEGSSAYWLAVLPMDTGNPVVAVSVAVGSGWRSLERTDYGYWVAASGAGPGPYQVRLTDDRGHTATATVPLYAGATVATGVRLY